MDTKFVFVFSFLPFLAAAEFRVMNTSLGEVTGRVDSVHQYGKVVRFMGIPYGKPPVGELRFKPPQMAGRFSHGHLNATVNGPNCYQMPDYLFAGTMDVATFNKEVSEDCLSLNIYKPDHRGPFAVMVWIHGGGYGTGAGALYDSRHLAVRGDVLVVTINYRLGLFGFVPNSRTESTLGIQDQILALKWVQSYIREFGGDPNQVTIFGESAGAQSVSFLTMSPKAKGLFKRAISQSGVASSPFAIEGAHEKMDVLQAKAEASGCTEDIIQCLKRQPAAVVLQWAFGVNPMPVPDGDVIPFDYDHIRHVHPDVDVIMGLNLGDGGLGVYYTCSAYLTKQCDIARGMTVDELVTSVQGLTVENPEEWDSIFDHYNDWYRAPYTEKISLLAADEFITDYIYRVPTNRTASMMASRGRNKVYAYQFNSTYEKPMIPWNGPWTGNAPHAEEVTFVFGVIPPTAHNYKVSDTIVRLWTDFAKGKNFTSDQWSSFTPQFANYLLFDDLNQGGAVRGPLMPEYKNYFWEHYQTYGQFPLRDIVSHASSSRDRGLAYAVILLIISFMLYKFKFR